MKGNLVLADKEPTLNPELQARETLGLGTPGNRDTLGLGTPGMSEEQTGRGEEFRAGRRVEFIH